MPALSTTSLYADGDLQSYYPLDGDSTDDISTNDGTDSNVSYSTANGKFGQGAGFSGNGYIEVSNTLKRIGNTNCTVIFWFKTALTSLQMLYAEGSTSSNNPLFQLYISSGAISLGIRNDTNTATDTMTSSDAVYADGFWHQLAITKTTTGYAMYVDGIKQTSMTSSIVPTVNRIGFGALLRAAESSYLTGAIDDIAFFDDVLTLTEIKSLYTAGNIVKYGSLSLNGSSQYAENNAPGSIFGKSACTIEAWFKPNTVNATQRAIFALGTVAGASEVYANIQMSTGNKAHGYMGINGSTYSIYSDTTITYDTWYHVAVTYDGSNIRLYLGTAGSPTAEDATAVSATGTMNTPGTSHDCVKIGCRGLTSETDRSNYFHGQVAMARYWDTARSEADILADRSKKLTGSESNLILSYECDEGEGTTITDSVGTANLTTGGSPSWTIKKPYYYYAETGDASLTAVTYDAGTAYLAANSPDTNYAGGNLTLGERNDQSAIVKRYPVKMDVSSIPAGSVIKSATLRIFFKTDRSSNSRECRAYRLKRDWVTSEVTWNSYSSGNSWGTAGATGSDDIYALESDAVTVTSAEPVPLYKEWSIPADHVQAWIDGDINNYGWLLKMDTESDDAYYGRAANDATYPLELFIEYTEASSSGASLLFYFM